MTREPRLDCEGNQRRTITNNKKKIKNMLISTYPCKTDNLHKRNINLDMCILISAKAVVKS